MTDDLRALLAMNAQARVASDPHALVDVWFAGPPADRATDLATLANTVFRRGFRGRRAMRSPALCALDRAIGGSDADHGELLSFGVLRPDVRRGRDRPRHRARRVAAGTGVLTGKERRSGHRERF
ncbi:hypothetical protein [Pseudonocardia sediminis]|uniref:hypothetical protein n=1 Tax=Pseudonocardia sediminis TaxID=1397368 RepID=UPI0013EF4E7F|nr:hypothetical protein [Pseudonocardia sediminis]